MQNASSSRVRYGFLFAAIGALAALMIHATAVAGAPGTSPADSMQHAQALVAFDQAAVKPPKSYRIAYLTECVDNPYCVARLRGIKDATEKFGMTFKVFDAQWSLLNQTKAVETAVTEGFDGFIFGPLAAQPACTLWTRSLRPSEKPVVTVTVPMCGDTDYTPGLGATVTMEGPVHYQELADHAFASCTTPCEAAVVGGFIGSDLQNYWEGAVRKAAAKYPNVKIVVDEAANFDPRVALRKTQDALLAHPGIKVIVSNWDDMTRGIEQGVVAAGKKPGSDVRIYSAGANKDTIAKIENGAITASMTLLPYEEGYYAVVALLMSIEGKGVNGYVDEADLPAVQATTASVMITKQNVDKYRAKY